MCLRFGVSSSGFEFDAVVNGTNANIYKAQRRLIPFDGRGDFFFCRTSPPKVPGEHPTKMRISGGVP